MIQPSKTTAHSVGYNIPLQRDINIAPNDSIMVDLGISFLIPFKYIASILPTSDMCRRKIHIQQFQPLLSDDVCSVKLYIFNANDEPVDILCGETICKIIFIPHIDPIIHKLELHEIFDIEMEEREAIENVQEHPIAHQQEDKQDDEEPMT